MLASLESVAEPSAEKTDQGSHQTDEAREYRDTLSNDESDNSAEEGRPDPASPMLRRRGSEVTRAAIEADEEVLGGHVDVAVQAERKHVSGWSETTAGKSTHMTEPTTRAGMATP